MKPRPGWVLLAQIGLILAAAALSIGFVHQHIRFATHIFSGDWLQMQFYWEAPRQTMLRHGQIPLWNPYYCGGNILMAHPHSQFVSPFFLFALFFGTSIGLRIALVGHLLLGVWGMNRLGKLFQMSFSARVYCALSFSFTGFFAWHIVGGHFWALGFHLLPLLYEAYLRALGPTAGLPKSPNQTAWIFWGGTLLAWMVFHAGMYSVPFTVLALGADALLRTGASQGRQRWRPIYISVSIGVLGFLLAGPKSFPLVDFLSDHHRTFNFKDDALVFEDLKRMFFGRSLEWKWDKAEGRLLYKWWGEYANDIGYPLIPLALVGFLGRFRKNWISLCICLLFFWAMLGEHSDWGLYALLRRLPVYKGLHVPSRFTIMVTFFLVLSAGFGLEILRGWLERNLGKRAALIAIWAVILVSFGEPYAHHTRVNVLNAHVRDNPVAPSPVFHQKEGSAKWMYRYAIQNSGSLQCYELAQLPRARGLRTGNKPEAYPEQQIMGEVTNTRWSPNLLEIEVMGWAPTRVLINQNFHKGWKVNEPNQLVNHQGQLAVDVPPGPHHVSLRYLPSPFLWGSMASSGLLLVFLTHLTFVFLRKRRVAGKNIDHV